MYGLAVHCSFLNCDGSTESIYETKFSSSMKSIQVEALMGNYKYDSKLSSLQATKFNGEN